MLLNIFSHNSFFNRISEEEYVKAITEEIKKVVDLQEELDIDVLVHGEPEVGQLPAYLYFHTCLRFLYPYAHTCMQNYGLVSLNAFDVCRGTIWLSTSESSSLVLLSLPMDGFNLMDLDV